MNIGLLFKMYLKGCCGTQQLEQAVHVQRLRVWLLQPFATFLHCSLSALFPNDKPRSTVFTKFVGSCCTRMLSGTSAKNNKCKYTILMVQRKGNISVFFGGYTRLVFDIYTNCQWGSLLSRRMQYQKKMKIKIFYWKLLSVKR